MSRQRHDPLATSTRPHWLTIADLHSNLIACEPLEPGTDLHEAMRAALAAWAADGWQAESDGRWGFCFARRGSERRLLNVTSVNPAAPNYGGHAHLAGRGALHGLVRGGESAQ